MKKKRKIKKVNITIIFSISVLLSHSSGHVWRILGNDNTNLIIQVMDSRTARIDVLIPVIIIPIPAVPEHLWRGDILISIISVMPFMNCTILFFGDIGRISTSFLGMEIPSSREGWSNDLCQAVP
jgi:hypothetical protein